MTKIFKVGDHVSWNSEAARVSGKIIKVHTRDFDYNPRMIRSTKSKATKRTMSRPTKAARLIASENVVLHNRTF